MSSYLGKKSPLSEYSYGIEAYKCSAYSGEVSVPWQRCIKQAATTPKSAVLSNEILRLPEQCRQNICLSVKMTFYRDGWTACWILVGDLKFVRATSFVPDPDLPYPANRSPKTSPYPSRECLTSAIPDRDGACPSDVVRNLRGAFAKAIREGKIHVYVYIYIRYLSPRHCPKTPLSPSSTLHGPSLRHPRQGQLKSQNSHTQPANSQNPPPSPSRTHSRAETPNTTYPIPPNQPLLPPSTHLPTQKANKLTGRLAIQKLNSASSSPIIFLSNPAFSTSNCTPHAISMLVNKNAASSTVPPTVNNP